MNNQTRLFITSFCASILVGCASGPTTGSMPVLKHSDQAGEVIVVRKSSIIGAAISYWLTYDGEEFFSIRNGQNVVLKVDPGSHHIGVKWFGGWSPTVKERSLPVSILPKQKLYFVVGPSGAGASIEAVSEAEGAQIKARTKPMTDSR